MGLSGCALDYARCLVNPFTGPLACVPNYPALLTQKQKVWIKGTMQTGPANGFGWIVVSPEWAAADDQVSCYSTTSSYAEPTGFVNLVTGPGIAGTASNSQYKGAAFSESDTLYRVVASGLRVRYTGTTFNQGGLATALTDPNHNSLQGLLQSGFDAEQPSRRFPVNREWVNVLYSPYHVTDTDFASTFPTHTPDPTDPSFYMGYYVTVPSGVSLSFDFEFFTVFEYQGPNIRGMTPSHFDPTGFAAVHGSAVSGGVNMPTNGSSESKEASFVSAVGSTLGTVVSVGSQVAQGYANGGTAEHATLGSDIGSVVHWIEDI
jgi:hypothetical protein